MQGWADRYRVEREIGRGGMARGGFVVDIDWTNGRLAQAVVTATREGTATVRYGERAKQITMRAGERRSVGPEGPS